LKYFGRQSGQCLATASKMGSNTRDAGEGEVKPSSNRFFPDIPSKVSAVEFRSASRS